MEKKDNVYIITGVFGHLGNTVARILLKHGERVIGLALENDKTVIADDKLLVIRGNVCDRESLVPMFKAAGEDNIIVIHTAGIVTIATKFDQRVYDVNVGGTKNMLELAMEYKVKKFIHVSSVHAIPAPKQEKPLCEVASFNPDEVEGLYAKTKSQATKLVLSYAKKGLPACVVHPSGIIGPYDFGSGHITQLVIDYLKGKLTACVKGGYDFVDVRDVATGIMECVKNGENGECYILSNRLITVKELLYELHKVSGKKEIKTVLPMWFAKLTAPLAEAYYKLLRQPPLYTSYSLYTLCSNGNFTHEKAEKSLNYKTRPLEDTLKDTVEFLKSTNRLKKAKHKPKLKPKLKYAKSSA